MSALAAPAPSPRLGLTLAELLSSLSYALDITEGQPAGHCVRVCWIGMHVGRRLGMREADLWELYYTLLLKDLGCSSNAARITELYLADDLAFKRAFKTVDRGLGPALRFVVEQTGAAAALPDRLRAVAGVLKGGGEIVQELIETRCVRGAEIARTLRFGDGVARGVHDLDEHWDGKGRPQTLKGEAISPYARIALLAQVVDVFHTSAGRAAAVAEIDRRRGSWFDPRVVEAFLEVSREPGFWSGLSDPKLQERIFAMEPAARRLELDDDYLDDIAAAFGQVIDAKSPYTGGHSTRVAEYAEAIGKILGLPAERLRWLRRGAFLHDLGKLGVSNAILDKPGRLDPEEWTKVQDHAAHTHAILSRIRVFHELARFSAAHHERLDGKGYPLGLTGDEIPLETRIITVADFYDALTADRPYRKAMPRTEALAVMRESLGSAIDREVFRALEIALALRPQ